MKKRHIYFFAIESDLPEIFSLVATQIDFQIYDISNPERLILISLTDINDLSQTSSSSVNLGNEYLLVKNGASINIRRVAQNRGGFKTFCDQAGNNDSVIIRFGGLHNSIGAVVAGVFHTGTESDWSDLLFKIMKKEMSKKFKKIHTFFVGSKSYKKLKDGTRHTMDIKSPVEYDLSMNP